MGKWDIGTGSTSKKTKQNPIAAAAGKGLKGLLGVLDAPQQVVAHLIKGARTADPGQLVEAAKSAAKFTLPGAPVEQEYLPFTEAIGAKKLPFGGETGGTILSDPLTYLTFGAGQIGRSALKNVSKHLTDEVAEAVSKGGLKALPKEAQEQLRQSLLTEATEQVGEKSAKKVTKAQMNALKSRARGGLGLHVPGTPIDVHLGGQFKEGLISEASKSLPHPGRVRNLLTRTAVPVEEVVDEAVVTAPRGSIEAKAPGLLSEIRSKGPAQWQYDIDAATETLNAAKAQRAALPDGAPEFGAADKAVRDAQKEVTRLSALKKMASASGIEDDVVTPGERGLLSNLEAGKSRLAERAARPAVEAAPPAAEKTGFLTKASRAMDERAIGKALDELASAPRKGPGGFERAWRRWAVSYPGTIVNRMKQAAYYGAVGGMRPDQWLRNMARGHKNYQAFEELLDKMKLRADDALESPEFRAKLVEVLGEQGAKEELAFRQFGEAATLFDNIDPQKNLFPGRAGEVFEKGRLVKKGGAKVREAGASVEESSRRAQFLHAAENKFGNYEEAGNYVRHVLPSVAAQSLAEQKIAAGLPFWTAMRADWQAVFRFMEDAPGRTIIASHMARNLPEEFKERHIPVLELAKALEIPEHLVKGELNSALVGMSEMTGGPFAETLEQIALAWERENRDIPKREQWTRFVEAYSPHLQRMPSVVKNTLAGKELTKKDKSAWEALVKFMTGIRVETGPETEKMETGRIKKSASSGSGKYSL